ncbi:MAG: nuclear transport factor 2 family protein [Betaproteobacteria bacterium]|nr:nuclear transport factor 2 family protein [Betaproteobacteria bacterium]
MRPTRSLFAGFIAMILCACQSVSPPAGFDARGLAAEEAKFAAHSVRHGMQPAFVEFMAPGSVLLRPHPVDGREYMRTRPNPPILLDWKSALTVLAASGELGLSTGPWIRTPSADPKAAPSFGQFFSIWRKQADGAWRVEFDHGISHAGHDGMQEALRALDLPRASTPGGPVPEQEFIALAGSGGARAAHARFATSTTRSLREGRAPIVAQGAVRSDQDAENRYAWTPDRTVTSAAGDFAYVLGRWTLPGAATGGTGYYMRVWITEAGSWRLAADIVTPDP